MSAKFTEFYKKMQAAGLNETVISAFKYYYDRLAAGETGYLTREMIRLPEPERIVDYARLSEGEYAPLDKLAVIKLNGGLGTSMGLDKAKSLLRIKDEHTFLDITARQILHYRQLQGKRIPLIFMNSFNTSADTLAYLQKYEELKLPELPLDFLQNKFPKVEAETLLPFSDEDDALTWNPPGHGEIYMVMQQSGILDLLLQKGYRYVFISNSDNLGAVVDQRILNLLVEQNIPFLMEVCQRTEMDKKGGHLAGDSASRLLLRESAQCPAEEIAEFQDIEYFRYFNTNNLWLNLEALAQKMTDYHNILHLSPIINRKLVKGKKVIQLESAMGAAINIFENARAIFVNRQRFLPVKKTNEFLAILSDAYKLTSDWQLQLVNDTEATPQITLDDNYYSQISDFEKHLAGGIPSLRKCRNLKIVGDIYFGENVIIEGSVSLHASGKVVLKDRTFTEGIYKL